MESLRIKNLRSLIDTNEIELKPITVFVGKNSSGKSTVLRSFPLLRQSFSSNIKGPILWYGQFVDFGSFQEAINRDLKNEPMVFEFKLPLVYDDTEKFFIRVYYRRPNLSFLNEGSARVKLYISADSKNEEALIKKVEIEIFDHMIEIYLQEERIENIIINQKDFSDQINGHEFHFNNTFIPRLERRYGNNNINKYSQEILYNNLSQLIKSKINSTISEENITKIIRAFRMGTKEKMLKQIQEAGCFLKTWDKRTKNWNVNNGEYQEVQNLFIFYNLDSILEFIEEYLLAYYKNCYYIAPLRATAERYYRLQNLAIDEVDFQGRNLAMFLRNMTQNQFKNFQNWTEKHFDFIPIISTNSGHTSIRIKTKGSNLASNLADTGFGFSQLLPIITQLWIVCNSEKRFFYRNNLFRKIPITFITEQPELHLHPALQAKMVDAFLVAINTANKNGIDLKIIIETHSETIINRLGHRINESKYIRSNEVNLVIFNKNLETNFTDVDFGKFDEEGFLENWPFGFFDPEDI